LVKANKLQGIFSGHSKQKVFGQYPYLSVFSVIQLFHIHIPFCFQHITDSVQHFACNADDGPTRAASFRTAGRMPSAGLGRARLLSGHFPRSCRAAVCVHGR
jgi:hypothetical protein